MRIEIGNPGLHAPLKSVPQRIVNVAANVWMVVAPAIPGGGIALKPFRAADNQWGYGLATRGHPLAARKTGCGPTDALPARAPIGGAGNLAVRAGAPPGVHEQRHSIRCEGGREV